MPGLFGSDLEARKVQPRSALVHGVINGMSWCHNRVRRSPPDYRGAYPQKRIAGACAQDGKQRAFLCIGGGAEAELSVGIARRGQAAAS